jgi:hypothetical protein
MLDDIIKRINYEQLKKAWDRKMEEMGTIKPILGQITNDDIRLFKYHLHKCNLVFKY